MSFPFLEGEFFGSKCFSSPEGHFYLVLSEEGKLSGRERGKGSGTGQNGDLTQIPPPVLIV